MKLSPIVAALALAACNDSAQDLTADPSAETSLPTEQAAPPGAGGLFMDVDGAVFPGETLTFIVSDATPNRPVYITYGGAELVGALCPSQLAGLCIDVKNPKILKDGRANASGVATITVTVPPTLPQGAIGFFQAAQTGTAAVAATSNIVTKFNPDPAGGQIDAVWFGVYAAQAGVSAEGFFAEDYASVRTLPNGSTVDLQWCRIGWDSVGTPATPCPGCDFAFDFAHSNPVDASLGGDCLGYFGFDATTAGDLSQRWAWDADYYRSGFGSYETLLYYFPEDTTVSPPVAAYWAPLVYVYPAFSPLFYTGGYFQVYASLGGFAY